MPGEDPDILDKIFSATGLSKETAKTFKFGGVVGKLAIISVGGIVGAIGVAKYTSGYPQLISILAVLGATLLVVRWTLNYAENHPISATLEGGEVILWQQQRMMLAAKGQQIITSDSPIIPNPGGAPPAAIVPLGDDE